MLHTDCVHTAVALAAAGCPDRIAISDDERQLTFAALMRESRALAARLGQLPLPAEGRVAIVVERSCNLLVSLLGTLAAGGVYVPLDMDAAPERLRTIVRDAAARCVVTTAALRARVTHLNLPILLLEERPVRAARQPHGRSSREDALRPIEDGRHLCYVLYTSGTTGEPKGVAVPHAAVMNLLRSVGEAIAQTAPDVWLAVTPATFDIAGLEWWLPLISGARVALAPRHSVSDGADLRARLTREGITVLQATPVTWRLLLNTGWQAPAGFRVLCGGEPLPAALARQLIATAGHVWNCYGPTETTIWSTLACLRDPETPVTIGRSIARTSIRLLDHKGEPVPPGDTGELHIGGIGLARAYLGQPRATALRFVPDAWADVPGARLYNTGDLARMAATGEIECLGRSDQQMKIRGQRIEGEAIEQVLEQHDGIAQAVVRAWGEGDRDRQLVAYVVAANGGAPEAQELRDFVRGRLPDYMVPSIVMLLERMPTTAHGKIDRKALPAPAILAGSHAAGIRIEPAADAAVPSSARVSEIAAAIAAVWREVLQVEHVSVEDNFFDLGGNSLKFAEVRARLPILAASGVSAVDLFTYPSVAALARHLAEPAGHDSPAAHGHGPSARTAGRKGVSSSTSSLEPIAVVAMAGRFPGAPTLEAFWANLRQGIESLSWFSDEELRAAGVPEQTFRDPRYVRMGAVLPDGELFDASFFGYLPREAALLDPQHRVLLECAWELLERGGYDPERYRGTIGIFGGVATNSYLVNNICQSALSGDRASFDTMFANDKDYVTTRIAYELDLHGPALTVQTACSTSLVAVHVACQHLWTRQCDMAIAGGAAVRCPQQAGYLFTDGMILSPDGHTRSFDARARGTVMGSGAGLVLLKRLSDAIDDGDRILAVVRGSAVNNDGADKAGYTAPSVQGQAEVIALAHRLAAIEARTVSYLEAHGTATAIGDPIELTALTQAFRATTDATGFCAIGSVKTNIGHADAAAGVAGFIKTVLALRHRELPPSLHFERANPEIDFARSPFYVNTELAPWRQDAGPRRAGVSSFGIGGTNAHVVLEEYTPPADDDGRITPAGSPSLLVMSARTRPALDIAAVNLSSWLSTHDLDMADAAWTLQIGRKAFAHRRAWIVDDRAAAIEALGRHDETTRIEGKAPEGGASTVFLFPGQGAQRPRMAWRYFDEDPVFRETFLACADRVAPIAGVHLSDIVFPGADTEALAASAAALDRTAITQPALFAVEYALARTLMAAGVRPDAMLGHSVGEYVAACVAGVMRVEDAVDLVAIRGQLVQAQPPGAMLAVRAPDADVRPHLEEGLSIAAINGPEQCVISGPTEIVERVARALDAEGLASRRLATSHAFHSSMMDGAAERFLEHVASVRLSPPRIPFLSNVTGTWIEAAQATDPRYWVRHLRETVRFADCVRTLLETPGRVWVESGPGQTLSALIRRQGGGPVVAPASSDADRPARAQLLHAVGTLWTHGASIDWQSASAGTRRRRVELPTYPFERQRCWITPSPDPLRRRDDDVPADPAHAGARADAGGGANGAAHAEGETGSTLVTPARSRAPLNTQATLVRVLQELSGLDERAIDVTASFLDLGFDSLMLTQAAREFGKAAEVPVTFRHLLVETPSIAKLTAYVDAERSRAASTPVAAAIATPTPVIAPPPPREAPRSAAGADTASPSVPAGEAGSGALAAFGPFSRQGDVELTARQRAHLDDLIARYTRRTAESKRLARQYRRVHADPRTVAGFHPLWKEMVYPIVTVRSAGSRLWDVDGNEYIDLLNGFGPNFLGHASPIVMDALRAQLDRGIEIGPQSPLAGEVAALVCKLTGMERACFVNTGSEAVQAAIRVARTVTGRSKIAFFTGDYHGNFDEVLVRAARRDGDGRAVPAAPGIPASAAANVIVLEFGAAESLARLRAQASEIAAVLVEPIQSRRPELQPRAFVQDLRKLTTEIGSLLIFDEVITGFRAGPGGAQAFYGVRADLATYGKVAGGGMPIGIVAGAADVMDTFDGGHWEYGDDSAPVKGVTFFAGTFVRHPLAMAAALATLRHLDEQGPALWRDLDARAARLASALDAFAARESLPIRVPSFCSLLFLRVASTHKLAQLLFFHLRARGIYVQEGFPSYLTLAHTEADVDRVIEQFEASALELREHGCFGDAGRASTFPLTGAQTEIWLATRLGPRASAAYNESCLLHLRGPLQIERLRQALTDVVERHEALRTTIDADGLTQRVAPRAGLTLEIWPDAGERTRGGAAVPVERIADLLRRDGMTPFDLAHGPLVRATLIATGPDHHVLVLTTHHIICDGGSTGRLLAELGARYSALVQQTAPPLTQAAPFRALAEWQRDYALSADSAAAERYWLNSLGDEPPVLELPTDRPHPPQRSYRGAREELPVAGDVLAALKSLGVRARCTLVAVQLAVFEVLLHRLTGQNDFIVGLPVSAHTVLGTADVAGHCTNLLPLRVAIEPSMRFDDHLARVQRVLFEVDEYRHYTYSRILGRRRVARPRGRLPLVEALFNVDRLPDLRFHDLDVELVDNQRHAFNFDFGLNCVQTDRTLTLQGDYCTDLLDADTVRRWLDHYRTLLASAAADPACRVGALPLLTDAQVGQLVESWDQPATTLQPGSYDTHR